MRGILIFLLLCSIHVKAELIFVIELSRHGARMPQTNPSEKDFPWIKGFMELTPAGMRQHYLFGTALRKRYIESASHKILGEEYNREEILIMAVNHTRTLASAHAQLLGLYPEMKGKKINPNLVQKAIPPNEMDYKEMIKSLGEYTVMYGVGIEPIITVQSDIDKLFYSEKACKSTPDLINYHKNNIKAEIAKKEEEFKDIKKKLKEAMKIKDENKGNTIDEVTKYRDVLISGITDGELDDNLQKLVDESLPLYLYHKYDMHIKSEYKEYLLAKLMATPLLKQVKTYLIKAKENKNGKLKYVMNVASDTLMQAILYQILKEQYYLSFASGLFLELYKKGDSYEVQAIFNNAECTYKLNDFLTFIDQITYNEAEFEHYCNTLVTEERIEENLLLPFIISTATLVLVVIAMIILVKDKPKEENETPSLIY